MSPPRKRAKPSLAPKEEWPASFIELHDIHFRLSSYYTFVSSRKSICTTFDLLKTAPEKTLKRSLTPLDVCKLVALQPNDIVFKYVDENQLSSNVETDVFEITAAEPLEQLLVLYFDDGDTRKNPSKGLQIPTYSAAEMQKAIARRDVRFCRVVAQFLLYCQTKGISQPMEYLTGQAARRIPRKTVFVDPVEAMAGSEGAQTSRPYISSFLTHLTQQPFYADQIPPTGHFITQPNEATYADLQFALSPALTEALTLKGISRTYSHQAEAINALHLRHHVIVSTSTSSGKSLIYQLPVLCQLEANPSATAMYIFPTKALAQDQTRALQEIIRAVPALSDVVVSTYDGDTAREHRPAIRESALVIFTNPDMLHNSILPSHPQWHRFLANLRYVVIDELHMYKDLFGAHVAFIMRRLRRACAFAGNTSLQFVLCSATLHDPVGHMARVFGIDPESITHVSEDGSPSGEKHLVVWNPPRKGQTRTSFIAEAARVLVELVVENVRTIAFCVVRRVCELLMRETRALLLARGRADLVPQVMSYRGGYSTADRRQIETEMFRGNLRAVVATNALELGIDIGGLDAALLCGFPLTTAKFRQQSGRAGRRNRDSLTILVGAEDPVNQYYMTHPEALVAPEGAHLVLDLRNELILEGHLQCAAFEAPIDLERDTAYFCEPATSNLDDTGLLHRVCSRSLNADANLYHPHGRYLPWPPKLVAIRAIEEDQYAVVDTTNGRNVVIEELEASRTAFELYDGGIFIHQGYPYLVREVSASDRYAKVERVDVDWYTSHRSYTDVNPTEIEYIRALGKTDVPVYYGKIQTTIKVFGFFKIDKRKRILDAVEVNSPPVVLDLKGLWIDMPPRVVRLIRAKGLCLAGGIHAAEHAVISILGVYISGGGNEILTECKSEKKEMPGRARGEISEKAGGVNVRDSTANESGTKGKETHAVSTPSTRTRPARMIFHDSKGGRQGSGLSAKVFENILDILRGALKRVVECPCLIGCIECIASPFCRENSLVLSKPAALLILYELCGIAYALDAIPQGPEENLGATVETVVEVEEMVKFAKNVVIIEDATGDVAVEAKAEVKAEVKPVAKTEAKTETKTEAETEAKTEPEAEAKTENDATRSNFTESVVIPVKAEAAPSIPLAGTVGRDIQPKPLASPPRPSSPASNDGWMDDPDIQHMLRYDGT